MTSARHPWPTRVDLSFGGVAPLVALDQIRTVDRARLAKRVGAVEDETARALCAPR